MSHITPFSLTFFSAGCIINLCALPKQTADGGKRLHKYIIYKRRDTMGPIDIRSWISDLTERLKAIFGGRLVYVGLQGSYRRGEADAKSDIDVMTVLDRLEPADLKTYRAAVGAMPYADKACGFICGRAELAAWPRHEQRNAGLLRRACLSAPCGTRRRYPRLCADQRGQSLPRSLPPRAVCG